MTLDRRAWLRIAAYFVVGLVIGAVIGYYIYESIVSWVPPVFGIVWAAFEMLRTRQAQVRAGRSPQSN